MNYKQRSKHCPDVISVFQKLAQHLPQTGNVVQRGTKFNRRAFASVTEPDKARSMVMQARIFRIHRQSKNNPKLSALPFNHDREGIIVVSECLSGFVRKPPQVNDLFGQDAIRLSSFRATF